MSWFVCRQNLVAVFVFVVAILPGAPALALEIISPANEALVSADTRLVIKGGNAPAVEAVVIVLNGEKSDILDISAAAYRQSFRDFVFLEVEYQAGVNQLEVEGYAAGKRVAVAKAKVYLPEGVMEPPSPFSAKFFHTAEREALCVGCHHNLDPSAKDLANPVPNQNPCGTCHASIASGKYVHGPAGVFDCTACHDPKSRPAKYAVADLDGAFCLDCHEDKLSEDFKAKFVHGPVETKHCLVCHDPHASDAPAQIRGATNALCSACHPEVVKAEAHVVRAIGGGGHPLEGVRNPAAPTKPFNCASCHEPHGAQNSRLLRGGEISRMSFCALCHKK